MLMSAARASASAAMELNDGIDIATDILGAHRSSGQGTIRMPLWYPTTTAGR